MRSSAVELIRRHSDERAVALERQFYVLLLQKLAIKDLDPAAQYDKAAWQVVKARLSALFASQPSACWCALLEGTDACFAPVLGIAEAAAHPRMAGCGIDSTSADGAGTRHPHLASCRSQSQPAPQNPEPGL